MLYTITARLLVDIDDDEFPAHQKAVVTDGLNELFRGTDGFVKDWAYDPDPKDPNERNVTARPDLVGRDYDEGDFMNVAVAAANEEVTHQVFFKNDTQTIGPVEVIAHTDLDDNMLMAAALAQNSVNHWEIEVKRLGDGHTETVDPGDARDWWA